MNTRLKTKIIVSGKTQRQIAKSTGIEEQRISEFVQEVRTPNEEQKIAIAKELECEVYDIF